MKKQKLFKCTSCNRKSDHLTTRWDKDGERLLDKGEKLCKRCMNKRLNGETKSVKQMFLDLSPEEQQAVLSQII